MGSELKCRAVIDGRARSGLALLETDQLLFRGEGVRVAVPLRGAEARALGESLRVRNGRASVELDLGAKAAVRWAAKINSPPSLFDKLGIKRGQAVALEGALDAKFVAEVEARATLVRAAGEASVILLAAESKARLAKLATLNKRMRADAALWVIYPKGQAAIRESDVLGAGRGAGLKDVKVARFSETHTALKFVIPLAQR